MLFPLKFIAQARISLDNAKYFGHEKYIVSDSKLGCAFFGNHKFHPKKDSSSLSQVDAFLDNLVL